MRRSLSVLPVLLLAMCVDRFDIEVGSSNTAMVINGFISDRPGPYQIQVTKAVELDSKLTIKTLVSVKSMVIFDNLGNRETLVQISQGVYQTNPAGIRGQVGRAYHLVVETLDGRTYESKPDTLRPTGVVEKISYDFRTDLVNDSTRYSFDIFFDANAGNQASYHYLWRFVGTYQIQTNPELHDEPCGQARCPRPRPCSGYNFNMEQIGSCTCCTCWASMVGDLPIVSDDQFVQGNKFPRTRITNVAVSPWVFSHKLYAEVQQHSLSRNAYAFWKAVNDQKEATGSLFLPISGKIPGNFMQTGGTPVRLDGLFYATSISSAATFINKTDIPSVGVILPPPSLPYKESCLLWGNSTNVKPTYWIE